MANTTAASNTASADTTERSASPRPPTDAYWHSLRYFNLYRIIVAVILFGTYFLMHQRLWWENYNSVLYLRASAAYLGFSIATLGLAVARWPRFNRQLTFQVGGDIAFIVLLMYAAGGVKSGLGLLLVVFIAGAALISQGRLALFYAALASIALLLEQSWQLLTWEERYDDYTHAVMLSLSCFATAWLAHSFAKRTQQSEALASQRGIDLENLAQVNQLVIQDMQDGILVVDAQFAVRHSNSQAERLLGLPTQQQREVGLDALAPEIAESLRNWIAHDRDSRAGLVKLRRSGQELRLRFLAVGSDRRQGAVIFIEDWGRVQAQARQLKLAALGRLTANIAHEIRNPLSAISHASQLLQEEQALDSTSQRLLQIIGDNVRRLDQIVQDVLQLNRRDRAQQESIMLDAFLREFREQFSQVEKIPQDGIALTLAASPCAIHFDRRQLHQILWNLCRNGWRHGRKRTGSLTLALAPSRRGGELILDITDDGEGIAPEVRTHLFEPFFTTESSGTGLGLYIARELCEANGASIEYVESVRGAHFRLYLNRSDG